MRIGHGFDVHELVENRKLIIGGVSIPFSKGLKGHSDADVLLHAISDALLGAAGLGDLGLHFPSDNEKFKNINSREILSAVKILIYGKGFKVVNVDATIIAELPKMSPFIGRMTENISSDLALKFEEVNVKATTTERLGFLGRGEGIAAEAVVLLDKFKRVN